ncbi:RNA polymerase sigma factor [Gimesia maris]|uniref:RNA polymerase sigma factor SigZ n=1 Tax=Gimesia maris TaxID=122 RepID=A0ABX5YJ71_9PLAN|nr:sigma-70 family RNA polymerase sigma factor [Gimesia maris]EDL57306.1 hypothetical protein PM8797T_16840 [Gimesia maris DSM 8797]QEG15568.1 RNA polymerase sigma factor SigZ [Gimesia maris]QGQ31136.1 sigma-70 family RNA polymerase sigma factor [Gimesia maris]
MPGEIENWLQSELNSITDRISIEIEDDQCPHWHAEGLHLHTQVQLSVQTAMVKLREEETRAAEGNETSEMLVVSLQASTQRLQHWLKARARSILFLSNWGNDVAQRVAADLARKFSHQGRYLNLVEDAVQDAFIEFQETLEEQGDEFPIASKSKFSAWIRVAAKRNLLDYGRREMKYCALPGETTDYLSSRSGYHLDPELVKLGKEIISRMPEEYREILGQRYADEATFSQIRFSLGVSLGKVFNDCQNAVSWLRQQFLDLEGSFVAEDWQVLTEIILLLLLNEDEDFNTTE